MNIIKKFWAIIVLMTSLSAILSALIAEHVFKILPCQMCLYQRYPYYFIIILSFVYIFSKKISLTWYYLICSFSFAIGLFFALWHTGIEQNILPGPSECLSTINTSQSLSELKEQILNQKIIACDEIIWSFLGLSAATWNSLLLILLFIINFIFLLQHFNEKEKKI